MDCIAEGLLWASPETTGTFDRYHSTIEGIKCNDVAIHKNKHEAVRPARQPGAYKKHGADTVTNASENSEFSSLIFIC